MKSKLLSLFKLEYLLDYFSKPVLLNCHQTRIYYGK